MKLVRRIMVIFLAVLMSLTLIGCAVTQFLHKDNSYIEKISSVMVSSDYKSLVVMSPKYHYIFKAPESIVWTLGSNFKEHARALFRDFRVDETNQITGTVTLSLRIRELDKEQKEQALSAGFWQHNKHLYKLTEEIGGTRYVSNGSIEKLYTHNFNNQYHVRIYDPSSGLPNPAKIALTPITLAADGVVTIGKIILFPIALVLMSTGAGGG